MTTAAILGLGEAGSRYAAGLIAAGVTVRGYDPRVALPFSYPSAASACAGASLVLSLNSAASALTALAEGLPGCGPGTLWAEMNTAAPSLKRAVAAAAAGRVVVVDVAIMAPVPPRGLFTPLSASGAGASDFAARLGGLGVPVEVIDGPLGAAATHKLLRSVFYKGLAAAVTEALAAAEAAGLRPWLEGNITEELIRSDASTLERLVSGSRQHAVRRAHEMEAAAQLLDDLGVPARVARAARDWLTDLSDQR